MTDPRQAELRRWIQEVAATSEAVELDDVLGWEAVDPKIGSSNDTTDPVPTFIYDPAEEAPRTIKRKAPLLTVAAALVAAVVFALLKPGDGNLTEAEVADVPTATATAPATGDDAVQTATAFWEAVAAGDGEAAIKLVDPALVDSDLVATFGRAYTLSGQFDWHEVVGWDWQLNDCVAIDDGDATAECSATARNAWSDALGVEPVTGIFTVRVGNNGITDIRDRDANFFDQWTRLVFNPFQIWVADNHPDDHEIMFDFSVDINAEILSLYEQNTSRFVEAQHEQ